MHPSHPNSFSFESRFRKESRLNRDARDEPYYEHNSPLEVGEQVTTMVGNVEGIVVESDIRDLLSRQEQVVILVKNPGGLEERLRLPASEVYRKRLRR